MRAVVVMVVAGITACAPRPAEQLRDPRPVPQPSPPPISVGPSPEVYRRTVVKVPRFHPKPSLTGLPVPPDPTDELLRWPLTGSEHPQLSPQFEIAAALAEPGVDWTDLCGMGAHKRLAGAKLRDELAYLRAWCAVAARDTNTALATLATLRTSLVRGLAPAVRQDIVNVLLDVSDVAQVTKLASQHGVLDADTLDLLAAMYIDLDRPHDGYELNGRALDADNRAVPERRCRRLARAIVMAPDRHRRALLPDAPILGEAFEHPTCKRLEAEIACWLKPEGGCGPWIALQNVSKEEQAVFAAAGRWPKRFAVSEQWVRVVNRAVDGLPREDAWNLALNALENAIKADHCVLRRTTTQWIQYLLDSSPDLARKTRLLDMQRDPDPLCE